MIKVFRGRISGFDLDRWLNGIDTDLRHKDKGVRLISVIHQDDGQSGVWYAVFDTFTADTSTVDTDPNK